MSTWRRKALELIPEQRKIIESSDSVDYLWCELSSLFDESIKRNNAPLTEGILKYASWCTSEEAGKPSNDTEQAVFCGFLEDITGNKKNFLLFKNWFTPSQFKKYQGSFMYALGDKAYTELENIFYGK